METVAKTGLLCGKPIGVPIKQNHKLDVSTAPLMDNPESYRRLVARLIYQSITRPELSYCVHVLAQFIQQPRLDHWEEALRVVLYLKGHLGKGIFLKADCDLHLSAYCDSDWASCLITRRSLTSYFVMLGGSSIALKIKKQHTVFVILPKLSIILWPQCVVS